MCLPLRSTTKTTTTERLRVCGREKRNSPHDVSNMRKYDNWIFDNVKNDVKQRLDWRSKLCVLLSANAIDTMQSIRIHCDIAKPSILRLIRMYYCTPTNSYYTNWMWTREFRFLFILFSSVFFSILFFFANFRKSQTSESNLQSEEVYAFRQ